jgi:hypothetical protein
VWALLNPTGLPPLPRAGHVAAYDPVGRAFLMFGGLNGRFTILNSGSGELWSLSLDGPPAWSVRAPPGLPATLSNAAGAVDPVGRGLYVHGGQYAGQDHWQRTSVSGDLFRFPLDAPGDFERVTPSGTSPLARHGHVAVWDPLRSRLVLHGGRDAADFPNTGKTPGSLLGDLWAVRLSPDPEWIPLTALGTPPSARYEHSAIYDPVRDRVLIFGGDDGALRNDVWELSLSTDPPVWSELSPLGTPPVARRAHAAVYDPTGDRMMIVGGYGPLPGPPEEVLSLAGPSPRWEPSGANATRRSNTVVVLDPGRDRLIRFGGFIQYDENGLERYQSLNDVQLLALAGGAWEVIPASGFPPSSRGEAVAAFDSLRDRMIVVGGRMLESGGGSTIYDPHWSDIFTLEFDKSVPTRISFVEWRVEDGVVHLRWWSPDGAQARVEVERREAHETDDKASWRSLGSIARVDASGRIDVEDRDVKPGGRYGYRLATWEGNAPVTTEEVWVDVPAAAGARLSVRAAGAHPITSSAWAVEVVLVSDAPATLELYDIAGRRLWTRSVTGLEPGAHSIPVVDVSGKPGIYLVRLSQGGLRAEGRLVRVAGR